uniref:Uncharacterized protein n=1 Tax=Solanum tuberosum TaxID=4113 RepID=M1DEX1_SOLTU
MTNPKRPLFRLRISNRRTNHSGEAGHCEGPRSVNLPMVGSWTPPIPDIRPQDSSRAVVLTTDHGGVREELGSNSP